MTIDWNTLFAHCERQAPATRDDIERLIEDLSRPVQASECRSIIDSQSNPWPTQHTLHASWSPIDPTAWPMPGVTLPSRWLEFLAWSNGGLVTNGEMEFCFFGAADIREFLLAYQIPEYMPQAIPLGLDGAGNFALLDVRQPLQGGEYPIVGAAAGNLGFEDARCLAPGFEAFCRRTESIETTLFDT
jgi:hypothetical protein